MTDTPTPTPAWLEGARAHAMKYLVMFANNPGVEKVVNEFDKNYVQIVDPVKRLYYLKDLAAREWDFRKGRERYEVNDVFDIDRPDSLVGKIVHEGARQAEMASASGATLRRYSIMAVLGGAGRSPYNRLKYALEQHVTSDMIAYLGSERAVLPAEEEKVHDYAPGATTEFDLGVGAIKTLMADELVGPLEYKLKTPESRIAYMQQKNGVPIVLLSAPPNQGGTRANTADTYDFLRLHSNVPLDETKNILFATSAIYRHFQYFDAVREITLKTGADIEVIGFDPAYGGMEFKPSQFLQELKSAADAAVRLYEATLK